MIADDDTGKDDDQQGDADEDNDFLSVKRVLPVDDETSDEELVAASGPVLRSSMALARSHL